MYKKLGQFALPVLMFAFVGTAQAEVINFTDKGSPFFDTVKIEFIDTALSEYASSGYADLTGWAASPIRQGDYWLPGALPPSFASASKELFVLDSMWLVGAWGSQSLIITGYANGDVVFTDTVDVTMTAQEFFFTGSKGIDMFTIQVIPDTFIGDASKGRYWGVGSITVSAVPEPEAYAMLLAGLGLVGVMARRRQRS